MLHATLTIIVQLKNVLLVTSVIVNGRFHFVILQQPSSIQHSSSADDGALERYVCRCYILLSTYFAFALD